MPRAETSNRGNALRWQETYSTNCIFPLHANRDALVRHKNILYQKKNVLANEQLPLGHSRCATPHLFAHVRHVFPHITPRLHLIASLLNEHLLTTVPANFKQKIETTKAF